LLSEGDSLDRAVPHHRARRGQGWTRDNYNLNVYERLQHLLHESGAFSE
jgi:hypothetical protein